MTSYCYIVMIMVDQFIIWFHLDCIVQFQYCCYFATNVCCKKSATTFGDLPDCLSDSGSLRVPQYKSWSPECRILHI